MTALSIRNPWAWAIIAGLKPVENRAWKTSFRGRIAVHTCGDLIVGRDDIDVLERYEGILEPVAEALIARPADFARHLGRLVYLGPDEALRATVAALSRVPLREEPGYIIGEVDIVDCVKGFDSPWALRGAWQFVLANPAAYSEPIPAKGKLNFWQWEKEEAA